MIERLPDWEQRLSEYIMALSDDPVFIWGERDCAMAAADAVLAMTGVDILAAFRGKYSTAAGSVRALKRYGTGDLRTTFDTLLPERPIGMARRGDVVMHEGAIGICMGAFALFVGAENGTDGLLRVPRAEWSHAWGVGE